MFELTENQNKVLKDWMFKQNKIALDQQNKELDDPFYKFNQSVNDGFAFSGTIGSDLTYCFTPTSLGTIIKVKNLLTSNEIDLTEYEKW